MKYRKISLDDRRRVFEAYNENKNWKELAKTLGIPLRTAYGWFEKNRIEPMKKGGSKPKKTEKIMNFIIEHIEKEPSVTLTQLAELIFVKFNVSVVINTVKNWLDGELFSVRPMVENVNLAENKIKRLQYLELLHESRSNGRTLIWIDETNFNLYCKLSQGRSKIGTKAAVVLPCSKGANLHCIGAMSDSKMLLFTTQRGSFKADSFNEWIKELISVCSAQGIDKPTLIIDNASAHTGLEAIIEVYENVELLRLAPYSCLLNPIKLVWSFIKNHIKRGLRQKIGELSMTQRTGSIGISEQRMRCLERLAVEAIGSVTGRMLANFANRVEKYYPAVMRQEDLKE